MEKDHSLTLLGTVTKDISQIIFLNLDKTEKRSSSIHLKQKKSIKFSLKMLARPLHIYKNKKN